EANNEETWCAAFTDKLPAGIPRKPTRSQPLHAHFPSQKQAVLRPSHGAPGDERMPMPRPPCFLVAPRRCVVVTELAVARGEIAQRVGEVVGRQQRLFLF